jgi:undecaprenyl-diphosphatase
MFKDQIETAARDLRLISIMLIVFGALLWWVDSSLPQTKSAREFNLQSALAMGAAQALALIPGVSRSGATIAAGRVMGFSRESAARFSFLLSVPAVVLSGLYQALGNINTEEISWGPTLVATVVAFASGYASIAWLLKYLATNSMRNFALYRFLVGGPVLVLALVGAIR